jgi:hypothetical protein
VLILRPKNAVLKILARSLRMNSLRSIDLLYITQARCPIPIC